MDALLFPFYAPARELALLDALSNEALLPYQLRDAAAQRRPREWRQTVNVRGFSPKEVSVRADNGKLRVHARHVDGDDVTEIHRSLQLPENVDQDKVASSFTRDGTLVVHAPFKEQQPAARGSSVWDEVRQLLRGPELGSSDAQIVDGEDGQKKYRAELSVREFRPEEVKVRQQGDCVIVEAEHKDEKDGQRVLRRLERAFRLPEGTKLDHLVSRLSHDGRLCLEAPYEPPESGSGQQQIRDVPMEQEQLPEQQQQQQLQQ